MVEKKIVIGKKCIERTISNANRLDMISREYQKRGDGLEALSAEYRARWKILKMQKLLEVEDIMG